MQREGVNNNNEEIQYAINPFLQSVILFTVLGNVKKASSHE
jgi:hypothetical protein